MTLSRLAFAAVAATFGLSAFGAALAQDMTPPAPPPAVAEVAPVAHGEWTLRQREEWLSDRLEKARVDGSLDHSQFEKAKHEMTDLRREEGRTRNHSHGQLTGDQTAELEAHLDAVGAKIHWANATAYNRPW